MYVVVVLYSAYSLHKMVRTDDKSTPLWVLDEENSMKMPTFINYAVDEIQLVWINNVFKCMHACIQALRLVEIIKLQSIKGATELHSHVLCIHF